MTSRRGHLFIIGGSALHNAMQQGFREHRVCVARTKSQQTLFLKISRKGNHHDPR